MKPITQLSAIVLAGGLSSRMGQDKALITINGVSLLQRTCQIALRCSDRVSVVCPWPERYRHQIDERVHWIQEIPLAGSANSQTPLQGFAQGLVQVQTQWVLLLACDLPRLRAEVLQTWAAQLEKTEAIALLPKHPEGWWEPLCGFYRRQCLPDLEAFTAAGGRSFQTWLKGQSVQELPVDPALIFNCNSPEDLEQLSLDMPH